MTESPGCLQPWNEGLRNEMNTKKRKLKAMQKEIVETENKMWYNNYLHRHPVFQYLQTFLNRVEICIVLEYMSMDYCNLCNVLFPKKFHSQNEMTCNKIVSNYGLICFEEENDQELLDYILTEARIPRTSMLYYESMHNAAAFTLSIFNGYLSIKNTKCQSWIIHFEEDIDHMDVHDEQRAKLKKFEI
jgi:hypothetical protein